MADNILPAACQSQSPQAAKRMRLDTDHESVDTSSVTSSEDSTRPLSSQETEMFEDPGHPHKVLGGLNRLRLNSALCDVILCCEGQEFPCHRYVLASFSSYFEAMFTSGMRESTQERVSISGVEPQVIGLLVNYAYTSEVSISTANVQALLAASNLWDVTAVKKACCRYMKRHMDVNNCVGIYCFSEDHSCETLKKRSMDYILEHFSVIYQQQEFLSLSVERLTEILASDLDVPMEDMVFEAAMLWLDKCPTRRQSFEKVLEQIRLPLISPSYLDTVIKSLDVVKEYQGCQRFISEAKEQPYCNTARPRRATVIVTVRKKKKEYGSDYAGKLKSFDPLTKQWKTLGRLPFEVDRHVVVASGCTLYVAGGYSHSHYQEIWRYDVHHNSWLELARMNLPHMSLNLVMLDGYVFAVGGRAKGKSADPMERYDTNTNANTWQLMETWQLLAPSHNNKAPIVVALDGWLYFIGGGDPDHRKSNLVQVAKYNPETTVWTEVAPMQIPRDQSSACVLNGKIYVLGGWHVTWTDSDSCTRSMMNTMECHNPKTNQWTMCAPMPEPLREPSVAVMDGKLYVLGGMVASGSTRYTQDIQRYCEETATWETAGQMPGRYGPRCVTLRLRNDYVMVDDDDDDDEAYDDDDEYRSDSNEDDDGCGYADDRAYDNNIGGGYNDNEGAYGYEYDEYGDI